MVMEALSILFDPPLNQARPIILILKVKNQVVESAHSHTLKVI